MLRSLYTLAALVAAIPAVVEGTACSTNSDCPINEFCSSEEDNAVKECAACVEAEDFLCPAYDGECCDIDFLSHCPTDPHSCVYKAESARHDAKLAFKEAKKTKIGKVAAKTAYQTAKRNLKAVKKVLKSAMKNGGKASKKLRKQILKAHKKAAKGLKGCRCLKKGMEKEIEANAKTYILHSHKFASECKRWDAFSDGDCAPGDYDYEYDYEDWAYCLQPYCAVDPKKCNAEYYAEDIGTATVYYSYATCGSTYVEPTEKPTPMPTNTKPTSMPTYTPK